MKKSKNIKFCAYLRYKKIFPIDIEKLSPGKAFYIYKMSDEDWNRHKIDFDKSDFIEYAICLDSIKDLAY